MLKKLENARLLQAKTDCFSWMTRWITNLRLNIDKILRLCCV